MTGCSPLSHMKRAVFSCCAGPSPQSYAWPNHCHPRTQQLQQVLHHKAGQAVHEIQLQTLSLPTCRPLTSSLVPSLITVTLGRSSCSRSCSKQPSSSRSDAQKAAVPSLQRCHPRCLVLFDLKAARCSKLQADGASHRSTPKKAAAARHRLTRSAWASFDVCFLLARCAGRARTHLVQGHDADSHALLHCTPGHGPHKVIGLVTRHCQAGHAIRLQQDLCSVSCESVRI